MLGWVLTGFPVSVSASDSIPWTTWDHMHPNSFPVGDESAFSQCNRVAKDSNEHIVTYSECDEDRDLRAKGQCVPEIIQRGTRLLALTGLRNGEKTVYYNKIVNLKEDPLAMVCRLGNGKKISFYSLEPGKSCYNVGVDEPDQLVQPPAVTKTITILRIKIGQATTVLGSPMPSIGAGAGYILPALPGCNTSSGIATSGGVTVYDGGKSSDLPPLGETGYSVKTIIEEN